MRLILIASLTLLSPGAGLYDFQPPPFVLTYKEKGVTIKFSSTRGTLSECLDKSQNMYDNMKHGQRYERIFKCAVE